MKTKKGLRKVSLWNEHGAKAFFIDDLVANAFLPNDHDGLDNIWHIDGNLSNDHAGNLKWSDQKQVTRSKKQTNARKPRKSLSQWEVDAVREEWMDGCETVDLAIKYDVSVSTIWHAIEGLDRGFELPKCAPEEEWAEMPEYDGRYYVSSYGRVFSTGSGRNRIRPRVLKQTIDAYGYPYVHLSNPEGVGKTFPVHRLVAELFCAGRTDEANFVNHIDGNKKNNHASNLEWVTNQRNIEHAVKVLGHKYGGNDQTLRRVHREIDLDPMSRSSPFRKFTDDEIRAIRSDPRSASKIAQDFGVNKSTIVRILRGETYKNI